MASTEQANAKHPMTDLACSHERRANRWIILVAALGAALSLAVSAGIRPSFADISERSLNRAVSDTRDIDEARRQTALRKEQADQAAYLNQIANYEYQEELRRTQLARSEQERRYQAQTNEINTVNQVVNTAGNTVRQIQSIARWGAGW